MVFQNFDNNALKDRTIQTQIIFGRKMNKLPKPSPAPLCVITNHPARYRDPRTGLPYYNAYAYREIQRLIRNEYRWSCALNAWVGSGTYAARGVPERFLNPNKKGPEKKEPAVGDETKGEAAKTTDVAPAPKGPDGTTGAQVPENTTNPVKEEPKPSPISPTRHGQGHCSGQHGCTWQLGTTPNSWTFNLNLSPGSSPGFSSSSYSSNLCSPHFRCSSCSPTSATGSDQPPTDCRGNCADTSSRGKMK
ncbi:hypothetical protein NW754_005475 [Fusarium falciforme]|nr:hypothetical protein NW754_005475 [Fusarium falciforme]